MGKSVYAYSREGAHLDTATKAELAQALCKEIGMEGRNRTDRHHYDKGTGTLYVGSHMFESGDLMAAKQYMLKRKMEMDAKNDAAANFFEIGMVAIEHLINDSAINGGRVVIKGA